MPPATGLRAHRHEVPLMEPPVIRPARHEDAPAIAALVDAAYRPYVPRIGREPAPMTADYAALIARGVVWVLDGDTGPCGVLVMWPEGDHLLLENIAVHPSAQGQGLGRRLMHIVEVEARGRGLRAVELYTNEVMVENLGFYQRLGYQEVDRRLDDGFRRVFMRKALPAGPDNAAASMR
jgi:ribosomal protein S18 acetylase RimI-like enzyme